MKHEEDNLQRAIIRHLRLNKIFVFSCPNGGSRKNAIEGYNLKLSGLMAGVSDLIILLNNRCIFVEIKTKKGKQQDSQKVFQDNVEKLGFEYLLWRDVGDCIDFILEEKKNEQYGNIT